MVKGKTCLIGVHWARLAIGYAHTKDALREDAKPHEENGDDEEETEHVLAPVVDALLSHITHYGSSTNCRQLQTVAISMTYDSGQPGLK